MQNKIVSGVLGLAVAASLLWSALLANTVAKLEKLMAPVKAQQAMTSRQQSLNKKFEERYAQDRQKYTPAQLQDAENLYHTILRSI
jgi:hypothetical protein